MARKPCVHHWIIETPNGPSVEGRCRKCRRKREFVSGDWNEPQWAGKGRKRRPLVGKRVG